MSLTIYFQDSVRKSKQIDYCWLLIHSSGFPHKALHVGVCWLTGNEIEALPVLTAGLDLTCEQVEFDRLPIWLKQNVTTEEMHVWLLHIPAITSKQNQNGFNLQAKKKFYNRVCPGYIQNRKCSCNPSALFFFFFLQWSNVQDGYFWQFFFFGSVSNHMYF